MPLYLQFRLVACVTLVLMVFVAGGCSINPTYTVRVDNQTNRPLRAAIERRPTINEIITVESGRVGPNNSPAHGLLHQPQIHR